MGWRGLLSDDPASADDLVLVIEDGCLTGCYGALWIVEGGKDLVRAGHFDGGPGWFMAVTDFYLHTHGRVEGGDGNPVDVAGAQCKGGSFGFIADDDLVGHAVYLDDVERIRR